MKRKDKLTKYKIRARRTTSARELFQIWDSVSTCYEDGEIDSRGLLEIKAIVWSMFETLSRLRRQINRAMAIS